MATKVTICIDVGTTSTGVSFYVGLSDVGQVCWSKGLKEEKIPTQIVYNSQGQVIAWGFNAVHKRMETRDSHLAEWFKLRLGDPTEDQTLTEKVFVDYLSNVYKDLSQSKEERFEGNFPTDKSWEELPIDFLFSIPTTWDPETAALFKKLAWTAGFGECENHSIKLTLTEPQAAAAFHLCRPREEGPALKDGTTVLVVDSGGGTTDFSLLQVKDDRHGHVETVLEVQPVTGYQIGGVGIDRDFESLVRAQLKKERVVLDCSLEDAACLMRLGKGFQEGKTRIGQTNCPRVFRFGVLGLKAGAPAPQRPQGAQSQIHGTSLRFTKEDLEKLFDRQFDMMQDEVLRYLCSVEPPDCILLAGGLGGSPYNVHKFQGLCKTVEKLRLHGTRVLVSELPRMAVSLGLSHYAKRNRELIANRQARAWIGVVKPLPAGGHKSRNWFRRIDFASKGQDKADAAAWEDGLEWLVRKSSKIPSTGTYQFKQTAIISADTPKHQRQWDMEMITSVEDVPSEKGIRRFSEKMLVDLSSLPERRAKRSFRKMFKNKKILEIDFFIEVTMGLTGATFRCFKDDKTIELTEPKEVGWADKDNTEGQGGEKPCSRCYGHGRDGGGGGTRS